MRKAAKAQWYAKHEGMTYGKILSFCPLNWTTTDDAAESVLQVAIDSCFFPIYEVERGKTHITYDPELLGRRRKITDWLGQMGKTKHLMAEGNEAAPGGYRRRSRTALAPDQGHARTSGAVNHG